MAHRFRGICQGFILAMFALLAAGCGGSPEAKPPLASPSTSSGRAFVNLMQAQVQQLRPGSAPRSLQSGENAELQAKDEIRADVRGRAFLEFPQQVEVELVRGSDMTIDDLRSEPSGAVVVSLKQIEGHSFTRIEARQKLQLTLSTDYATIVPLADDSQFLVCHVPGTLSCVVAVNGQARVDANSQTVTLKAGEGTFITPNQAPHAPFCADLNQIRDWWSRVRAGTDMDSLSSMMVAWMQTSCGTASPEVAVAAAAATPVAPVPAPSPLAAAPASPTVAPTPTTAPTTTSAPAPTQTSSPTNTPLPTPTPSRPAAPTASSTAAARLPASDGMVKIGPGNYVVGSAVEDDYHVTSRQIQLQGFWIDKFPATNNQYKSFIDGTGRPAPIGWRAGAFPAGRANHPAIGLTWDDAQAFCAWVNKRLPGEAEWEVAGRGQAYDPPLYPWGSDPTAGGRALNLPQGETYEVGTVAFNHSPFGVYDMIGTIWQWLDRPYAPVAAGMKILRGGRYGLLEDLAYRQPAKADDARFTRVAGVRSAADTVIGE